MKVRLNKDFIRKLCLIAGISFVCGSISGCGKDNEEIQTITIEYSHENEDDSSNISEDYTNMDTDIDEYSEETSNETEESQKNSTTNNLEQGAKEWLKEYQKSKTEKHSVGFYDIKVLQYIIDWTNPEMEQILLNEEYFSLIDSLSDDLSQDELITLNYTVGNKDITFEQIQEKYDLLLKACIRVNENSFDTNTMYQSLTLLSDSYKKYSKRYPRQIKKMAQNLLIEARNHLDCLNQDIQIFDAEGKETLYADFDQMYLIINEDGKSMLGERYLTLHNKEMYFIFNKNASYQEHESDRVVSLSDLREYDYEKKDSYTYEDWIDNYIEYSKEKGLDHREISRSK